MSQKLQTVLVNKIVYGDREAFEQLFTLKRKLIAYKIMTIINNSNDVEDIAQEVAIRVFQHIGSLKEPAAFNGWLNTIIIRECAKYFMIKKRLGLAENTSENEENGNEFFETDKDFLPETHMECTERRDEIMTAMVCLSEKDRKMFLLHYESGKCYREIAGLMGLSIGAVCSYMSRVKKRLQKELPQYRKTNFQDAEEVVFPVSMAAYHSS